MSNIRRIPSDNEKILLMHETDLMCPLCGKNFIKQKVKNYIKSCDIAHIYPLNPTPYEIKLLLNEEKLFDMDPNFIENLIALCPNCHDIYDKKKTINEYRHLLSIKKDVLRKIRNKEALRVDNLETEINLIINELCTSDNNTLNQFPKLSYEGLAIDEKFDDSLTFLAKSKISNLVATYFNFVRNSFKSLEDGKFEIIAFQFKIAYLKCKANATSQEDIWKDLISWLNTKTGSKSNEASEIIIAFFIQNCEVFEIVTTKQTI